MLPSTHHNTVSRCPRDARPPARRRAAGGAWRARGRGRGGAGYYHRRSLVNLQEGEDSVVNHSRPWRNSQKYSNFAQTRRFPGTLSDHITLAKIEYMEWSLCRFLSVNFA